jgi:hypothetical protein
MRTPDAVDLVWSLVILILVVCLLLLTAVNLRTADLKETREQLSVCTQQVDWWREKFGAGRVEDATEK